MRCTNTPTIPPNAPRPAIIAIAEEITRRSIVVVAVTMKIIEYAIAAERVPTMTPALYLKKKKPLTSPTTNGVMIERMKKSPKFSSIPAATNANTRTMFSLY